MSQPNIDPNAYQGALDELQSRLNAILAVVGAHPEIAAEVAAALDNHGTIAHDAATNSVVDARLNALRATFDRARAALPVVPSVEA